MQRIRIENDKHILGKEAHLHGCRTSELTPLTVAKKRRNMHSENLGAIFVLRALCGHTRNASVNEKGLEVLCQAILIAGDGHCQQR